AAVEVPGPPMAPAPRAPDVLAESPHPSPRVSESAETLRRPTAAPPPAVPSRTATPAPPDPGLRGPAIDTGTSASRGLAAAVTPATTSSDLSAGHVKAPGPATTGPR